MFLTKYWPASRAAGCLFLCLLLPGLSNAQCSLPAEFSVKVAFSGAICIPENWWCAPSVFPEEGAIGDYWTTGRILAVMSPPWIRQHGNEQQGFIQVLPNSGTERIGTVTLVVAYYDMIFQCAIEVRQASASLRPRLVNPKILSDGRFGFALEETIDHPYVIEVSTNLLSWFPIATNTGALGLTFSDKAPVTHSTRFYRVAVLR